MHLSRVLIKNFKSIPPDGVEIKFRKESRVAILVGKNNAGKSNILEGIGRILGQTSLWRDSFPAEVFNDSNQPIILEAEINDATFADGKAAGLTDGQCRALEREHKLKASYPGRILIRFTVPAPAVNDLMENEADEDPGPQKPTFEFLANVAEVKRNADRVRQALAKQILVPTLRNQSDLLSPSAWTAYGRLLRDVLADSGKLAELVDIINSASEHLREILSAEASHLTRTARATSFVDEIGFSLTKEGDPIELLRNLSLAVAYAGRTEDISRVGTGTQSAVMIGILELCLRHKANRRLRLFTVEEPELFLHPQAQRLVAELLRAIALEERSAVVLTTHSSAILAASDLLDVIRVDRDAKKATRCLRLPPDYDGLEQWERILDANRAEALFADMVVLVEGQSEATLLPALSKLVCIDGDSCDFDRANVSVVNVDGKTAFWKYTRLLEALEIGWTVVADRDALDEGGLGNFKTLAGVEEGDDFAAQHKKLLDIGVAVLSDGEIEDYYPADALAEMANCDVEEVTKLVDNHKETLGRPQQAHVMARLIEERKDEICANNAIDAAQAAAWLDSTRAALLREGQLPLKVLKTGKALENWLDTPKPVLAMRMSKWFQEHPQKIPEKLSNLIEWIRKRSC